jgi:hypothetical protein
MEWIIVLVIVILIVSFIREMIVYKNKIYKSEIKRLEGAIKRLLNEVSELEGAIRAKDNLYEQIKSKSNNSISKITSLYSDFLTLQYDISSRYLNNKKHPAHKEAERIEDLKKKTKIYIEQYKIMQYKYELLLDLYPELSVYVDDFETIGNLTQFTSIENLQGEYDRTQNYLTKDEYKKLSEIDRNQLALDRYITRTDKTNWQIGRDYEMYCGYVYIKNGWSVNFFGIERRLEDMGRDLIAKKSNTIHIVQCKFWSQKKIIHEKYIAQLFGSAFEYALSLEPSLFKPSIIPVFITNVELSETATKFAKRLEVLIYKWDMDNFPRIKCNINNGNKIYHLPFDQQYDRTKIENEGESYEFTVKDAVNKGFRRAYKYRGF